MSFIVPFIGAPPSRRPRCAAEHPEVLKGVSRSRGLFAHRHGCRLGFLGLLTRDFFPSKVRNVYFDYACIEYQSSPKVTSFVTLGYGSLLVSILGMIVSVKA